MPVLAQLVGHCDCTRKFCVHSCFDFCFSEPPLRSQPYWVQVSGYIFPPIWSEIQSCLHILINTYTPMIWVSLTAVFQPIAKPSFSPRAAVWLFFSILTKKVFYRVGDHLRSSAVWVNLGLLVSSILASKFKCRFLHENLPLVSQARLLREIL